MAGHIVRIIPIVIFPSFQSDSQNLSFTYDCLEFTLLYCNRILELKVGGYFSNNIIPLPLFREIENGADLFRRYSCSIGEH